MRRVSCSSRMAISGSTTSCHRPRTDAPAPRSSSAVRATGPGSPPASRSSRTSRPNPGSVESRHEEVHGARARAARAHPAEQGHGARPCAGARARRGGTRALGRATLTPERLESTHRTAAEHAWRHVLAESPPGMDLTAAPVFHLSRHDIVHRVVVRPKASCMQELVHHHDLHHCPRRSGAVTRRRQRHEYPSGLGAQGAVVIPPAAHERQARRPVATVRRQRAAAGLSRDGPSGRLDLELRRASLSGLIEPQGDVLGLEQAVDLAYRRREHIPPGAAVQRSPAREAEHPCLTYSIDPPVVGHVSLLSVSPATSAGTVNHSSTTPTCLPACNITPARLENASSEAPPWSRARAACRPSRWRTGRAGNRSGLGGG